MKRFACHYLYVSADSRYPKYVVELKDDDEVGFYFPLQEELSATQWIGGVIIFSPLPKLEICSGEKFAEFLQRAAAEKTETNRPVYAWHIADFDLQNQEFTSRSVLVRL